MMMVMIELMRGWWGLKEQKWAESLFWRRFMRWGGNSDVTLRRERKCLKVETAASCGRKQKWTSWHRAPLWLICVLVHLYCSIIRGDGQLFGNEEEYLFIFWEKCPQKEQYSFNSKTSNSEPLLAIKIFDMTRLAGFAKTILTRSCKGIQVVLCRNGSKPSYTPYFQLFWLPTKTCFVLSWRQRKVIDRRELNLKVLGNFVLM